MRIMDANLMDHPSKGIVSMIYHMADLRFHVGTKHIWRLFKLMGRETLYRSKNFTINGLLEYIRPYLLMNLKIERSNQMWLIYITYISQIRTDLCIWCHLWKYSAGKYFLGSFPTAKRFKQVLEEVIREYWKPEIINSDQGNQYTSAP